MLFTISSDIDSIAREYFKHDNRTKMLKILNKFEGLTDEQVMYKLGLYYIPGHPIDVEDLEWAVEEYAEAEGIKV